MNTDSYAGRKDVMNVRESGKFIIPNWGIEYFQNVPDVRGMDI